jgi:hypothetical protein
MELDGLARIAARFQGARHQRLPSVGLFAHPLQISYLFGIPRK